MQVPFFTFLITLFLLGVFFALKKWEERRGSKIAPTRFFESRSPAAQMRFETFLVQALSGIVRTFLHLRALSISAFHRVVAYIRRGVVMLAAKMVRAVRGEKILTQNGGASVYLKHLRDHKENIGNGSDTV